MTGARRRVLVDRQVAPILIVPGRARAKQMAEMPLAMRPLAPNHQAVACCPETNRTDISN